MSKELIDTKQIEQHFEAANEAAEKSSKMARGAVIEAIEAGEHLTRAKDDMPHGEWSVWLGRHWNYSQDTATRYMTLANSACVRNLKEAKSINEALRMIADDKEEKKVPRSERKAADVVVSVPDESDETKEAESDDDPAPDQPTQRKTAKGSEKIPEDKKPRTQQVPAEIVDDEPESDPWEYMTFGDIIAVAISKLGDDTQQKKAAKELRKLADKLDPPTKFVKPDGSDVLAFLTGYVTTDKFISKYGALTPDDVETAADGFIDHYSSNGWMVGKVKMQDWRATARKWVSNQGQFGKVSGNGAANRGSTKPAKPTGASVFG